MRNQRGGVITKLIFIPAGIALMVGFFLLGYSVGRYQSRSAAQDGAAPPLPEIVSKNIPKPEEFTFYKTLTEKENRTVSLDLRPQPQKSEGSAGPKQTAGPSKENPAQPAPGIKEENKAAPPEPFKANVQADRKPAPAPAKSSPSRLCYAIQLSSHQEKKDAEEEVKRMKQNGFAAFIISSDLPGKGTWYRVRLGSFSNRTAAERLQREVRAKAGASSIVVIE